MPSRGEGFGIVFLEALASGIPVVASKLDGGREALMDGRLGILVDPNNPADILTGIERALGTSRGVVPAELGLYAYPSFEARCHQLLEHFLH
jgi:phosphatidylinositol alpha-1,6-mannosyltransferase